MTYHLLFLGGEGGVVRVRWFGIGIGIGIHGHGIPVESGYFLPVPVQVVFVGLFVGIYLSRLSTSFVPFRWLFVGLFLVGLLQVPCFACRIFLLSSDSVASWILSGVFVAFALVLALAFT